MLDTEIGSHFSRPTDAVTLVTDDNAVAFCTRLQVAAIKLRADTFDAPAYVAFACAAKDDCEETTPPI